MMRTAEYMGILFRSELVQFGSKDQMKQSRNSIIRQCLAGKSEGPIGMDEMSGDVDLGAEESEEEADERDRTDEIMTV